MIGDDFQHSFFMKLICLKSPTYLP